MPEYKSFHDLVLEVAQRQARWRTIRRVMYSVCAVLVTVSLMWMAFHK